MSRTGGGAVRAELTVAYADTRAEMLSFSLREPLREALSVLTIERAGVPVQLRVLGASHQVVAGPITETVACLAGRREGVPAAVTDEVGGWSYGFAAQVERYGPGEFAGRVRALRRALDRRADAIIGQFPGSPYAVTALAAAPDFLGWQTWHAYPQTGQIVTTQTKVEPR